MERTFDVEFGIYLDGLLGLGGLVMIDDLHFWIALEDVMHPDVQGLMHMLKQITVNFYNGKHRIPNTPEYIDSLLRGIDAQVSQHLKLCLDWSHEVEEVDGKLWLRVAAKPYEFATPIGYTTQ